MAICRRRRRRLTRMEGRGSGRPARTLARTHTHSTHSTLAALTRRSSVRDPSLCLRLRLCPLPSSLRRVPAGSSFPSRPEARGGDGESCSLPRSPTRLSSSPLSVDLLTWVHQSPGERTDGLTYHHAVRHVGGGRLSAFPGSRSLWRLGRSRQYCSSMTHYGNLHYRSLPP